MTKDGDGANVFNVRAVEINGTAKSGILRDLAIVNHHFA
jgi:hypothetical protein